LKENQEEGKRRRREEEKKATDTELSEAAEIYTALNFAEAEQSTCKIRCEKARGVFLVSMIR
jgi:hypothetical protein